MSRLTYAQKFSFAESIAEFMEQNKPSLEIAGLVVDPKIADQKKMNDIALQEDVKQETMKAELGKQTTRAVESLEVAYRNASDNVDAMVGVLGKDSQLAKRLRQLRDEMRR